MNNYDTLTVGGLRRFTNRILYPLKGVFPFLFIVGNLTFWIAPLFFMALLKLLIPLRKARSFLYKIMTRIYVLAVWADDQLLWRFLGLHLEVRGLERLHRDKIYLVLSNHQSWADIFIIQSILRLKAPIPKFIVKKELFFMPLVGLICWAYDFPFVRRYTKQELWDRPERKGKDKKALKSTLSRFDETPGSIVNFAEGTRYSPAKSKHQKSPYRFLLSPKVGGLSVILQSMGDQLHQILDLTLTYDSSRLNFWDFLCGKCRRVVVQVSHIAPEKAFVKSKSDLTNVLPEEVADWINTLWEFKDHLVQEMRTELNKSRLASKWQES
jgi:1-acyl-sn-glycerol-3-phosphate acyltransferase